MACVHYLLIISIVSRMVEQDLTPSINNATRRERRVRITRLSRLVALLMDGIGGEGGIRTPGPLV